jgi:hypothetical protein
MICRGRGTDILRVYSNHTARVARELRVLSKYPKNGGFLSMIISAYNLSKTNSKSSTLKASQEHQANCKLDKNASRCSTRLWEESLHISVAARACRAVQAKQLLKVHAALKCWEEEQEFTLGHRTRKRTHSIVHWH